MTWTPGLVMDYCVLLRRVLDASERNSRYQKAASRIKLEVRLAVRSLLRQTKGGFR